MIYNFLQEYLSLHMKHSYCPLPNGSKNYSDYPQYRHVLFSYVSTSSDSYFISFNWSIFLFNKFSCELYRDNFLFASYNFICKRCTSLDEEVFTFYIFQESLHACFQTSTSLTLSCRLCLSCLFSISRFVFYYFKCEI